jgi:hypothetical protein
MNITLASGHPPQVRIQWEPYDKSTEAVILERLKTVPNIEGAGRRWYAPAIQLERLMVLFPKAEFQYAAMCAADKAARDFFDSLIGTGVKLVLDNGTVHAVGDNVSPLIDQLVADRSPALVSLVELDVQRQALKPQVQPVEPVVGPLTRDESLVESMGKGILNAQKRDEELKRYQYGGRRRKAQPKQGGLGLSYDG